MPHVLVALFALVVVFASSSARAAPCDGFTDVEDTSPFCVNVAWMKNRGITLGCAATLYCPNDFVTRLQMAAFMYRLGFQNAHLQGGSAFGATAVLGTTDNQPLDMRVNNSRVMRYEPSAISPNVIGGSPANNVTAGVRGATIAGGGVTTGDTDPDFVGEAPNRVTDAYGTVGGGFGNRAGDNAGTTIDSPFATVGGGYLNTASGDYSTVGGGIGNQSGLVGTVGGGNANSATGPWSTVGGGAGNTASGGYSTVGGGHQNLASGNFSWAGGAFARTQTAAAPPVVHHGAFVWADSNLLDFHSSASNEFAVRATGGARFVAAIDGNGAPTRTVSINSNGELGFGANVRQMLNLWGALYGIGVQASGMYFRVDPPIGVTGGFNWYRGGSHDDNADNAGGGFTLMRLDRSGNLFTAGAINPPSDAALKTDFQPVDAQDVLAKVAAMPIASWRYREDPTAQRHLGPTAQDFRAAFELGAGERTIATVDADGVALAAIQGLNAKLEAKVAEQARALTEERAAREAQAREIAELRRLLEQLIANR